MFLKERFENIIRLTNNKKDAIFLLKVIFQNFHFLNFKLIESLIYFNESYEIFDFPNGVPFFTSLISDYC